jgi:cellulase/cellobiase CelA1
LLSFSDSPDDAEIGKALKAIEKEYLRDSSWESAAKSARGEQKRSSQFDRIPSKQTTGKEKELILTGSLPSPIVVEDTRFADVLFVQEEADDDSSSSSTSSSSSSSDTSDPETAASSKARVEPKVDNPLPAPPDWKS